MTAHYNTQAAPLEPLLAAFGAGRVQALQADLAREEDAERLFAVAAEGMGPVEVRRPTPLSPLHALFPPPLPFPPALPSSRSTFSVEWRWRTLMRDTRGQVVVINHARYEARYVPLAEMELAQWEETFRTNVMSSFLVARAFLRGLAAAPSPSRERAAVVLIGSTAGKLGEGGHADYAASKSGECWPRRRGRGNGLDVLTDDPSDDVRHVFEFEERNRQDRAEGESECRRPG